MQDIKRFLCVESGEQFYVKAVSLEEAQQKASMWNASVVRPLSTEENEQVEEHLRIKKQQQKR